MPAGIGSLWPAEVGTRWTRHDWGRGDGRGEESGTHRRDRLRCSIYAHAARYSGAARHPNSLSGWHSKLHNFFLPNKDINMIRRSVSTNIVRSWLCQRCRKVAYVPHSLWSIRGIKDSPGARTDPGGPVYACIFRAWFVCTHLNLVIFWHSIKIKCTSYRRIHRTWDHLGPYVPLGRRMECLSNITLTFWPFDLKQPAFCTLGYTW